jgi:hypothetical protein
VSERHDCYNISINHTLYVDRRVKRCAIWLLFVYLLGAEHTANHILSQLHVGNRYASISSRQELAKTLTASNDQFH